MDLKLSNDQRINIQKMVANLVDTKDKTDAIKRWGFDVNIIPEDMAFERAAYEAVMALTSTGQEPNQANVEVFLSNHFEGAKETLDELIQMKTLDGGVEAFAHAFSDWSQGKRIQLAVSSASDIAGDYNLTSEEKYRQITEKIQKSMPYSRRFETLTSDQIARKWLEYQRKNIEMLQSGQNIGPRLPWPSSFSLIPYLRPGELCLIEGVTGFGKTTLGTYIGQHIAHEQPGLDVLFIHLETDAVTLLSRYLSQKFLVPIKSLDLGEHVLPNGNVEPVDMSRGSWSKKFEKVVNEIRAKEDKNGRMWYHHANGATITDIDIEIHRRQMEADRAGRRLVVIIDYFQKINWMSTYGNFKSDVFGLNEVARQLKNIAEHHGAFIIVLAQSAPTTEYDPGFTTRGAKEINIVSQIVLHINREISATDTHMSHFKNAFGESVAWHRVGEKHSKIEIDMIKANNLATGSFNIYSLNEYFSFKESKTVK